ncbi:MAG TPA: FKBP-type peptidyl-prolyl cis-trans isomerase [Ginsengibacter sp.]
MMVKGLLFGLFVISIAFASCLKKNSTGGSCGFPTTNVSVPDSQVVATNDSIYGHGITNSTLDPAGFYYHVDSAGSGASVAGLCSTIYVTYKGTYFNGVAFDSTATNDVASFQLGAALVGWQKALPLLKKGGEMTLYLPPALAYGSNAYLDNFGNVLIPASSYLVFDIHLVDIQ